MPRMFCKGWGKSRPHHITVWDYLKKVARKLAGKSFGTATWVTNVNENGQVIMSVLTASEGFSLGPMIEGLIDTGWWG